MAHSLKHRIQSDKGVRQLKRRRAKLNSRRTPHDLLPGHFFCCIGPGASRLRISDPTPASIRVVRVCKLTLMPASTGPRDRHPVGQGTLSHHPGRGHHLHEAASETGLDAQRDLQTAPTMFAVATLVGANALREVDRRGTASSSRPMAILAPASCSAARSPAKPPASSRSMPPAISSRPTIRAPFLQIGETKYGKPIPGSGAQLEDHAGRSGQTRAALLRTPRCAATSRSACRST